ncbi:MAG: hypothetical protein ABSF65_10185 [Candidatus Bathyarchaeia archaeon]|jgi:hypothetical protein
MSETKTIVSAAVKSTPYIARLSLSLTWMYLTLGYRVRKTRGAFEKQLVAQGMSKENAKLLSESFEDLKNEITGGLKKAVISRSR